jgi:hypothetical protein
MVTPPDQVRAALRAAARAALDHEERVAFYRLAEIANPDALLKLRAGLR